MWQVPSVCLSKKENTQSFSHCAYLSPRSLRTSSFGAQSYFRWGEGTKHQLWGWTGCLPGQLSHPLASSPHLPKADSVIILMCVRQSAALGVPWSQTTNILPLPSVHPLCSHWHPRASPGGTQSSQHFRGYLVAQDKVLFEVKASLVIWRVFSQSPCTCRRGEACVRAVCLSDVWQILPLPCSPSRVAAAAGDLKTQARERDSCLLGATSP